MSATSRSKHARVAIEDLRKLQVHPRTLGPYKLIPSLATNSGFESVRAFGPGSVIPTRSGVAYQVHASGQFRRLNP